jgi:hypothetical protein
MRFLGLLLACKDASRLASGFKIIVMLLRFLAAFLSFNVFHSNLLGDS